MQIGLGSKKTEAVAFIPPRLRASHPLLPQLSVKGVVVPWATEYRYLAYLARDDLCDDGSLTATTEKLAGQWQRYFSTTGSIQKHSPAFALQIFKTTVFDKLLACLREPLTGRSPPPRHRIPERRSESLAPQRS